ncbi:YwmB family TATA-box binding protein [Ornithinibacillus contaminans]|uniref:YwmB family TATA-box binding protein n=1 Tax=Ornithinibacillus contaminans TaxID=694055 RepID=UPI00064D882E|nr:YwmB family TATA-box binding protein [Ornithinibacillus contaminans]
MKRILMISLGVMFIANTVMAQKIDTNELIEIAGMMEENDLDIDSWEVTVKENKTESMLQDIIQELSTGYSVTKEENENSIIYSVTDTHKTGNLFVTYRALFPKNKQYQAELVVTIQGNTWGAEVQSDYLENLSNITGKYFSDNAKIYSCMNSKASAIMKKDYIVKNLTKKLDLRHKYRQNDNLNTTRNIEIIYGYTSLWSHAITIQDTPVNVQIVTKHGGNGGVQFTIGTPILINEY